MRVSVSMTTRLTESPLRVGFTVTESAANTFTTSTIALPSVPSVAVTRGDVKTLGIEIMDITSELDQPEEEAGQNNLVQFEIVKGSAPTAMLQADDQRTIYRRKRANRDTEVTAVGQIFQLSEDTVPRDMTDHDGNGEIVADNEIHASIVGTGNVGVKKCIGYILYHLVELDANEAVFEMIETLS